jgi:hypothetical protein
VLVPQNGPISIAFNANGMDFYIHGVTGCTQGWCDSGSIDHHVPCDPAVLDHAVLIVGYGTQTSSAYDLTQKAVPTDDLPTVESGDDSDDGDDDDSEIPYWLIKNRRVVVVVVDARALTPRRARPCRALLPRAPTPPPHRPDARVSLRSRCGRARRADDRSRDADNRRTVVIDRWRFRVERIRGRSTARRLTRATNDEPTEMKYARHVCHVRARAAGVRTGARRATTASCAARTTAASPTSRSTRSSPSRATTTATTPRERRRAGGALYILPPP